MKVLIVLNEHPLGSHPDVYDAFTQLTAEGVITGFDVIPALHMLRQGLTDQAVSEQIRDVVLSGGHQLVIWMHTGGFRVSGAILDAVKQAPQGVRMVYWEGDSYHPLYKPLPNSMLSVMRRCDDVYLPCGGAVLRTLRMGGVRRVRYAPNCASGTRFPLVWDADEPHDESIVVIGNRITSKIPFKRMPGARRRERLVKKLVKRYGKMVAVYGHGWRGPSAMGPCDFDDQSMVYRSALITVGADNATDRYHFSNRLPIAHASGIPTLYHSNAGFGELFADEIMSCFFDQDAELFGSIERLLQADTQMLRRMTIRNRAYFEENFTRYIVAKYIVMVAVEPDVVQPNVPRWQRLQPLVEPV